MSTGAFAARMGQDKKTLQAGLPDFCFFSANPRLLGSSVPIRAIRVLVIKFNARPLTLDARLTFLHRKEVYR
jgi:hypothetical protein